MVLLDLVSKQQHLLRLSWVCPPPHPHYPSLFWQPQLIFLSVKERRRNGRNVARCQTVFRRLFHTAPECHIFEILAGQGFFQMPQCNHASALWSEKSLVPTGPNGIGLRSVHLLFSIILLYLPVHLCQYSTPLTPSPQRGTLRSKQSQWRGYVCGEKDRPTKTANRRQAAWVIFLKGNSDTILPVLKTLLILEIQALLWVLEFNPCSSSSLAPAALVMLNDLYLLKSTLTLSLCLHGGPSV